ncbi:MAG: DUF5688 family protein [Lachnospiraceae bacterium]|nr:DUF5688 family protein [Lachnospiraceae bacterium]
MKSNAHLSYPEFKEIILSELKLRFPEASIESHSVVKNNDTYLDGIYLKRPGGNIAPQVYLNHFYEDYENETACLNEIISDISSVFIENQPVPDVDPEFLSDFSAIQDRIVFDLISLPRNHDFLSDLPYISYLDLAIVFRVLIHADDNGRSSILIHNYHLEDWEVSKETLLDKARQNTPRLLPASIESITDVLGDLTSEEILEPSDYTPMYVLSNQCRLNGAACMLYPHLLERFSREKGMDFYIIPSSIHEVLLVPAALSGGPEELNAMVQEVNATELAEDEILSEHVYYFSGQRNAVSASEGRG